MPLHSLGFLSTGRIARECLIPHTQISLPKDFLIPKSGIKRILEARIYLVSSMKSFIFGPKNYLSVLSDKL